MGQQRKDFRRAVLEFVADYIADCGYPPTYDEIQHALHLSSKSHVDYYLDALKKTGQIEQTPRKARGLRLVGLSPAAFSVEIKGSIAAGGPIDLDNQDSQPLDLTPAIADPRKQLYALSVKGDSMVDALVSDGDVIVVEQRDEVPTGQMAVVHLRDANQATLKRVYPEGDRVRLQPAHPTMPAFYVPAEDVEIQGRVVAIVRRLA